MSIASSSHNTRKQKWLLNRITEAPILKESSNFKTKLSGFFVSFLQDGPSCHCLLFCTLVKLPRQKQMWHTISLHIVQAWSSVHNVLIRIESSHFVCLGFSPTLPSRKKITVDYCLPRKAAALTITLFFLLGLPKDSKSCRHAADIKLLSYVAILNTIVNGVSSVYSPKWSKTSVLTFIYLFIFSMMASHILPS